MEMYFIKQITYIFIFKSEIFNFLFKINENSPKNGDLNDSHQSPEPEDENL